MKRVIFFIIILLTVNICFAVNTNLLNKNKPIKLISFLDVLTKEQEKRDITSTEKIAFNIMYISEINYNMNLLMNRIQKAIFKFIKSKTASKEKKKNVLIGLVEADECMTNYVIGDLYKKTIQIARESRGRAIVGKEVPYKELIIRTLKILRNIDAQIKILKSLIATSEITATNINEKVKFVTLNNRGLVLVKSLIIDLIKLNLVKGITLLKVD